MPCFANCQIGIKIGESILEEYGTQIIESSVTTWIASESGKEFDVVFRAEHHPCSLQLVIFVDGVELVNRGYEHRKMGKEIICSGLSVNAEAVQPFVFSDIVFPEENSEFNHYGMGNIGTIRIEVLQVVFSESTDPCYTIPSLCNYPHNKGSKITGASGVALGERKKFRSKKMTSSPFDPQNPGPVVSFNYIYRPRTMLIAQGIIPTYVPKLESVDNIEPSPHLTPKDTIKEERLRLLREQQEQVQRELRELEELRRLRERQAEIQRELDELENFGFGAHE